MLQYNEQPARIYLIQAALAKIVECLTLHFLLSTLGVRHTSDAVVCRLHC